MEIPLNLIALEAEQMIYRNCMFKAHFVRIFARRNNSGNYRKFVDIPFCSATTE